MSASRESRSLARRRVFAAAVLSSLVVVVLVPMAPAQAAAATILTSRSSVIGGESITVHGTLGQRKARPVVLQRQSGARWINLINSRSTSTGSFGFLFRPSTKTGTRTVIRVIAPKTRISGKPYAQIVTVGRRVLTIGQTATATVPAITAQGSTFTIKGKFTPARLGRTVAVQKPANGTWVGVKQSIEASDGSVSIPLSLSTEGTFTFRLAALGADGAPAVASASGAIIVTMPAPTGLAAVADNGGAHLTWKAVTASGLAGYNVYKTTDGSGSPGSFGAKINANPIAGTSFDVPSLTNGTKYYFAVTSVNTNSDESAFSIKANATPVAPIDTTPPPVPTGLMGNAGDANVQLTWTAVSAGDLQGYNVYQSASAGGPYTKRNSTPIPTNGFSATALTNGNTYFFKVSSVDTTGNESSQSAPVSGSPVGPPDTTPPPVPIGVAASAGDTTAAVTWTAVSAADLAGYNVYQGTNASGPWTKLTASPITATTLPVSSLTDGTPYFFAVTSIDTTGNESAKSTVVSATPVGGPSGWTEVSAGSQHTCAVGSNGTLWCWGLNRSGELGSATGVGLGDPNSAPARVGGATNWVHVSAGGNSVSGRGFTCGVQSDGTLWCWGSNKYGQLGNTTNLGTDDPTSVPTQVGIGTTWSSVSAGMSSTCGLQTNGTAWCWGLNYDGELGNTAHITTEDPTTAPTQVGSGTTWSSVSVGSDQTCATRADNTLWCWGGNVYGQLGNSVHLDGTPTTSPTQVAGAWSQVSTGSGFTCAVQTGGTVWCWGLNIYGQLGNTTGVTTFDQHPTPTQVGTASNWSTISAGDNQTCAVTTAHAAFCWGRNDLGELGSSSHVGTTTATTSPVQVGSATNWSSIDAGAVHTCARTTGGGVFCWGSNESGQLGVATNAGTTTANPTPTVVPLP
jgi:alpha-tubulin suppressor-like RCC1 family protein/fibronectin type 3 domain-containing protein